MSDIKQVVKDALRAAGCEHARATKISQKHLSRHKRQVGRVKTRHVRGRAISGVVLTVLPGFCIETSGMALDFWGLLTPYRTFGLPHPNVAAKTPLLPPGMWMGGAGHLRFVYGLS